MKKWEYVTLGGLQAEKETRFTVGFPDGTTKDYEGEEVFVNKILNELGQEGWEVVSFNRAPVSALLDSGKTLMSILTSAVLKRIVQE